MTSVTLRVLDGADRGKVFENLEAPITIGREEGNSVQLNDERISRFHIKIQEDQDKLVLTDLESTNGTRVNGEDTHLRILRYGDVISVGRSVLLFGTREEIAHRIHELRHDGVCGKEEFATSELAAAANSGSLSFELRLGASEEMQGTLHIPVPPDLPSGSDRGPGGAAFRTDRVSAPAGAADRPRRERRRQRTQGDSHRRTMAGLSRPAIATGRVSQSDW